MHAPTGGVASPSAGRERDQQRRAARPTGSAAIASRSAAAHAGARPAAPRVCPRRSTSPPEQRPADAERDRVGAADRAGGGERAGQVLGVDQQPDAEHRQRQAGDDREDEHAASAGGLT